MACTINEDAESPELERGAWPVVAQKQRGRSGDHIGAGTRHLAAPSVSVSARRACARPCDAGWRTVGAGNIQVPRDVLAQLRAYSRRSGLPLSVIVTEAIEKRLTATTSARKTWLSALQSVRQFVWNLLSIASSPSN